MKTPKAEEGATEVDRTIETAAGKVKANHMVSVLVTLSAITTFAFTFPSCNFWISRRIIRSILINQEALLELKQGRTLTTMAQWVLHSRGSIGYH